MRDSQPGGWFVRHVSRNKSVPGKCRRNGSITLNLGPCAGRTYRADVATSQARINSAGKGPRSVLDEIFEQSVSDCTVE
jgi:hypothetical protein